MQPSRRRFLKLSAAGALGAGLSHGAAEGTGRSSWPIAAFEKNFQRLSYDELGKLMAGLGFDGIEATVRRGGHIEPERAVEELPVAVDSLRKHGLEILAMATGINTVDSRAEKILRTAAKLGIKRYRMGYYRYNGDRPIGKQLSDHRARAVDLAAMNKEIGIAAVYQNHAGAGHVGAALWDLDILLEGIEPSQIGVALDLRHSRVEAGMSWKTSYRLLRPHITMIFAKDSKWEGTASPMVPLGSGIVDREVFQEATKGIGPLPISLHVEYFGGKPLSREELKPVIGAHRRDLATLKSWL